METQEMIGNFLDFRQSLIEEREETKSKWSAFVESIDAMPDGTEKNQAIRESLNLYDDFEEAEKRVHDLECQHVMHQLGSVLPKVLADVLNSSRDWSKKRLDEMFVEYEDARKKGVPFAEREKMIDSKRVAMMKKFANEPDVRPSDIILRPAQYWLPEGTGYDKLKELGVRKFCELNAMFMYDLKNK